MLGAAVEVPGAAVDAFLFVVLPVGAWVVDAESKSGTDKEGI